MKQEKLDFNQVSKYLDDKLILGIKPSLLRINKILELMDNPNRDIDYIHVVGTNGKTSTAIILASILKTLGFKTAYHISPKIESYTERIWLDGDLISEEKFTRSFNRMYPYIEKVNRLDLGGPITQFETVSALAFMIVRDEGMQVMVLEAGMGGRWDATNVADACVTGLTGVSLEHTEILGETIEEITREKVEVIKKGARAATISTERKVLEIFKEKAEKMGAEQYLYGKDFDITGKRMLGINGWEVDLKGIYGYYPAIRLPLMGDYQPLNLSLAVCLAELYTDIKDKKLDPSQLKESLSDIYVKGRFEILKEDPIVIADASHNLESIEKFCHTIKEYFWDRKKTVIFAVLSDKDYPRMIEVISDVADRLIFTSSENSRSLELRDLKKEFVSIMDNRQDISKVPDEVYTIDTVKNSLNYALKISDTSDIICITGSITNLEHLDIKM